MTKTYSEQRQAILFRAARELRKVAAQVLDDVQDEVELRSTTTPAWAVSVAKYHADRANELENEGYEQCSSSARAQNAQRASSGYYSKSIDAFEARLKAAWS